MKASVRFFLIGFISLVLSNNVMAAHIVGGDVTYTFRNFNEDSSMVTFTIVFTMYRDSRGGGADFDDIETRFGVFRQNVSGGWRLYREVRSVSPMNRRDVPPNDDPCVEEPIGLIGVEEATYTFDVTLEVGDRDYMIAYQRCCRNESINNIRVPGETGAAFDVIITPEAQRTGNSSPRFNSFPPIFICAGFPISVDQSASDSNGDEIRYTFCSPFSAGGDADAQVNNGLEGCCDCVRPEPARCGPPFSTVFFQPPYSANAPLAGDPVVRIDNETGLITGVPEFTGQFVVGVCVEEFRNGVSLGKIRRDFQFNVLECNATVVAALAADEQIPLPGSTLFVINSCGDSTLKIRNISTDVRFIESYRWEFFNEDQSILFESQGGAEARDADVNFPGLGTYTGNLYVNEGLECADSASFEINLFPAIFADYDNNFDTCVAGPVAFKDFSRTDALAIIDWDWDFDGEGQSDVPDPSFNFESPGIRPVTLIVTDNNACKDTLTKDVVYQPAPSEIIVRPSSFVGCVPSEIFLDNLSTPIDSTYDILWDLGDGNFSSEISPRHTYLEPGNYSISLDIVSPIGCEISRSYDGLISMKASPVADFICNPEELNFFNRTSTFTNLSTDADRWKWEFGTGAVIFEESPSFTFPDTGVYRVKLSAFHPVTNCPDTISKLIDVVPSVNFFFPNAFSPNNDSSNDLFLGNGYYDGLRNYSLSIWNRWGQKVFETDNPRQGWNGQEFNAGKLAPQGVYVYKATYEDPRGDRKDFDGHVTLIR